MSLPSWYKSSVFAVADNESLSASSGLDPGQTTGPLAHLKDRISPDPDYASERKSSQTHKC